MLKISVITPSYNQCQFIEETIQSVLAQHYDSFEHIVIDGASTDNTVEILKKYPHLIWVSEPDNGQSDAINKGMRKATGEIVCWINSDDVLLPGTLKRVSEFYLIHPEVCFLNGLTIRIDKENRFLGVGHILINKWFQKRGCYNISQQGMFWKRELFQQIGYLNTAFHASMDLEFIVRVYESGVKMAKIDIAFGAIRIHEATKTAIGGSIWSDDLINLQTMYKDKYRFKKNLFYFMLYILVKFIKGMYFNDMYLKIRYYKKNINDITYFAE